MSYSAMDIEPTNETEGYIGDYEYTATYRPQTQRWSAVVGEHGRIGFGSSEYRCVAIVKAANAADLN